MSENEIGSPPRPTVLQRELSLVYTYPHDKTIIEVPLKYRIKYDRVMYELQQK